MDALLRIGLSNAACAAVLAVAASVLGHALRRPAATHALWVLVLLKLLTPPLWVLPVLPAHRALTAGGVQATSEPRLLEAGASLPRPPGVAPAADQSPDYLTWLIRSGCSLWLAGSIACAFIAAVRMRRFRRLLYFASIAPDDVQKQASRLASLLGLRRSPPVWMLPGPVCPMLWAAGRPRLLLPENLCDRLTDAQRATLLLHELAHWKRRDHWVRVIELLTTVLHWWNPVVWWARHRLREAEEQCCDAWVAWAMPAGTEDYAAALVEVVEFASCFDPVFRPMSPALASGIGQFRYLKRRLVMIQQGKSTRTLGPIGTIIVCMAATLLPLSVSRAQEKNTAPERAQGDADEHRAAGAATSPSPQAKVGRAVTAQLDRNLPEVRFDAVGFGDVIDFLRDVSGSNIFVDWKALEAAGIDRNSPVSVSLHGIKFSKALSVILDSVAGRGKVGYTVDHGVIAIAPLDEPSPVVRRTYDIRDLSGGNAARGDKLVHTVLDSIDPKSWDDNGGNVGTIKREGDKLIVVQNEANQKAVSKLLNHMRELLKTDSH